MPPLSPQASSDIPQKSSLAWGPKAAIIVSVLAYVSSQLILIVPLMLFYAVQQNQDIDSALNSSWVQLCLSGVSAATILGVLWLFLHRRKQSFKNLGFKKIRWSDIGWLLVATLIYIITLIMVMAAATHIPGFNADEAQDVGYQGVNGWQLGLAFIGLVVLPPLAEEMLFRGFLYRGLASKWPKIIAALVTSALFALVHFQWNVGLDVFVLSLILIALYEKTKNLWMCIFLHALKNGMAFLALFIFT